MKRGRLAAVAVGAVLLAGAVVTLRSGVEAPAPPAIGPDGERISAFHDGSVVVPPTRPDEPPQTPGALHTDARSGGVLVSWPAAPHGFEVRWGRLGTPLDQLRYVVSTAVTLTGLDPGRYRVEVRAVDEVGRRSEPSATDLEVSGETPGWQRGLGFAQDFVRGAKLDPDAWLVEASNSRCARRDVDGSILLRAQCVAQLQPASRLTLSEPGQDGVRGRVVVIADTPQAARNDASGAEQPNPDELMVNVSPSGALAEESVMLQVGAFSSRLLAGAETAGSPATPLVQDVVGGPGAQHRWELAFTDEQVLVLRDGIQVGSAAFSPSWQEADVTISAFISAEDLRVGSRVSFVGLTGPAPDGRPTTVTRLAETLGEGTSPPSEHRLAVQAAPSTETARLRGGLSAAGGSDKLQQLLRAPDVVAEFAGQTVPLRRLNTGSVDKGTYAVEAELPADGLRTGGELVLRSVDGSGFALFDVTLEVRHRPGTPVPQRDLPVQRPADAVLPRPDLVVRNDGRELVSNQRINGDELEIEVEVGSMLAQNAVTGLVGWVALRVELDGRRILDHPTALDGPAVAGTYRFTLKTATLADTSQTLVVSLIPDRAGVAVNSEHFTIRMKN